MIRFPGFYIFLLTQLVWGKRLLESDAPFEIDLSKFKLAEAFYPENDRDAFPVIHSIRKAQFPEIDVKNYKLPEEFYPEIDRDAIPIMPTRRRLINSKQWQQKETDPVGARRNMLPINIKDMKLPEKENFKWWLLKGSRYLNERSDNSLEGEDNSLLWNEEISRDSLEKELLETKRKILEGLKMLKVLEKIKKFKTPLYIGSDYN